MLRLCKPSADVRGALPFRTGAFDLVFNLRYLQHAHAESDRVRALAELVRVSRRYVLLSYYRRSNVHAVIRTLQSVTRGSRRRTPSMIDGGEFARLVRSAGCRTVADRGIVPWFHAQRLVLLEKTNERPIAVARMRTAGDEPRVATGGGWAAGWGGRDGRVAAAAGVALRSRGGHGGRGRARTP